MAISYGTGTATQFTDASARQVLELGKKIHYYNPSVTPILTVGGRASTRNTPVPIFEWMEDEYNFKKSISLAAADMQQDVDIFDSADASADGDGCIIKLQRQAQMELFEVGGIYAVSAGLGESATHAVCVATGKNCNRTAATDKDVQFVVGTVSGSTFTYNQIANSTDMFAHNTACNIEMVGRINSKSSTGGKHVSAWMTAGEDADGIANGETATFAGLSGFAEGADIGEQTSKKVRRLKNCTQIFREPYMITGTAKAAKHYGGSELSRLQARKLNKIKSDIEWAILTNGDISLDATAENPTRTFAGFGLGGSAGTGVCISNDGRGNTEFQFDTSDAATAATAFDDLENITAGLFQDMAGGSMKKTVFCSNKWLKQVSKAARTVTGAQLNMEMGKENTAGLRVMKYLGSVGELEFIPHPMLNSHLEDYAVAIDFANFDWRPLAGRNLKLRKDCVQNGQDGQTDEWLIEAGPEIRNEQTHAVLKIVA